MGQLSLMMPCNIKRGKWALCEVEPTIHPFLKVSLSISSATLIYYQNVQKRASVEMKTQGQGWGPLSFISCYYCFVVVLSEIC